MKHEFAFAKRLLSQLPGYITGGVLVAILVIWDYVNSSVPSWAKGFAIIGAVIVASYYAWREEFERAEKAENRLIPRLEICSGTMFKEERHRIIVRNLSAKTIRFGALLESVSPPIKQGLPINLQITHKGATDAEIPAYGHSLVDIFLDIPDDIDYGGDNIDHAGIYFCTFGEPRGTTFAKRQRYLIKIRVYPTESEGGIGCVREFHIIPRLGEQSILSDAGAPYEVHDRSLTA